MFVIRKDHQHAIILGTLQSESGQEVLRSIGYADPQLDSITLIKEGRLYRKSAAALEILISFGGVWRIFKILLLLPRPARDWIYDIMAKNRYAIFGKRDQCMVPGPELKDRFLE